MRSSLRPGKIPKLSFFPWWLKRSNNMLHVSADDTRKGFAASNISFANIKTGLEAAKQAIGTGISRHRLRWCNTVFKGIHITMPTGIIEFAREQTVLYIRMHATSQQPSRATGIPKLTHVSEPKNNSKNTTYLPHSVWKTWSHVMFIWQQPSNTQ